MAYLAPAGLPEMARWVVQVTDCGVTEQKDMQVVREDETLPLSQGSGDLVLTPALLGLRFSVRII